jgi:8-oxo-dGTP diphosphatase
MTYTYTLAFIRRNDDILLINRNKKPWKGAWNGVGGKIQNDESPLECIIREIREETNIIVHPNQIIDKGILTWTHFDANGNGLHLFMVEVDEDLEYLTPRKTEEGILDWKSIAWINDYENEGIAKNIPYFLPKLLNSHHRYHVHCIFEDRILKSVNLKTIDNL